MDTARNASINLESLLDLSTHLNESDDEHFILNSVLLSTMGKLRFSRGVMLIKTSEGFIPEIVKGKTREFIQQTISISHLVSREDTDFPHENVFLSQYNYISPIIYQNDVIALLCLGNPVGSRKTMDIWELQYLKLICTIAANSIQRVRNFRSLKHQNLLLTTLYEISKDFSSLLSREQIIKMLSFHLMGKLMTNRFAVFHKKSGDLECVVNRFRLPLNENLIKECFINEKILAQLQSSPESLSKEVCVISPMSVSGRITGLLLVGKKVSAKNFDAADMNFIESLGNISASSLENERLIKEELEKLRLESELNYAHEIQKNLMPKQNPDSSWLEIAGINLPSEQVGGDYYDFIDAGDGKIGFVIADVSGKGLPASLIMANLQAALRITAPAESALSDTISRVNQILYDNTAGDKFVTLFYGVTDSKSRTMTYINAGHNPPVLVSQSGGIRYLDQGGLILGFTDKPFPFKQETLSIASGDIIVMFTDGVTEAQNAEKVDYTEQRLESVIYNNRMKNAKAILDAIIEDVNEYCKGNAQYDDITLIVIKSK